MPTAVYDPTTGALLGIERLIARIYNDISNLTGPQKQAIWADLQEGSPHRYLRSEGKNAGSLAICHWIVTFSGAAGQSLNNAQLTAMACYTQDYPTYLVHPDFDPSINIPGYDPP